MADYKVNMKQWNGSSFDNVLPLAFNSKALEGKSYDDIVQYTKSFNGNVCEIGSYLGTGTVGENTPTTITFSNLPALVIVGGAGNESTVVVNGVDQGTSTSGNSGMIVSWTSNSVSFSYNGTDGADQNNAARALYRYCMFSVLGGQFEQTITSSGTWTVPKTGRYYIELYGGGGGAVKNSRYQGGSSCQSYDSITLTKGESIFVTIGNRGTGGSVAGSTSFGTYSVNGGGMSTSSSGGSGAGNKGTNGSYYYGVTKNPSSGTLGETYGFGMNANADKDEWGTGGSGAVYLKYLGE